MMAMAEFGAPPAARLSRKDTTACEVAATSMPAPFLPPFTPTGVPELSKTTDGSIGVVATVGASSERYACTGAESMDGP